MWNTDAPDYVEKLIDALNHREPLTQVRAAWLLGKIGDRRAVRPLIESVTTRRDDPEYLATAAAALGSLNDASAVPALIGLSRSSFLKARLAAVEALARWASHPRVQRALRGARQDPNVIVRDAAERVLMSLTGADRRPDGSSGSGDCAPARVQPAPRPAKHR